MQERGELNELAYLHDAVVNEILWTDVQGTKVTRLTVTCDDECARDDWAGRQIVVTFNDVILQTSLLHGYVDGQDTFDSHSDVLSQELRESLQKLSALGIPQPRICVRIALHSGSELQLACDSVTIQAISH